MNHIPCRQMLILSSHGHISTRLVILIHISRTKLVAKGEIVPKFGLKYIKFWQFVPCCLHGFHYKVQLFFSPDLFNRPFIPYEKNYKNILVSLSKTDFSKVPIVDGVLCNSLRQVQAKSQHLISW